MAMSLHHIFQKLDLSPYFGFDRNKNVFSFLSAIFQLPNLVFLRCGALMASKYTPIEPIEPSKRSRLSFNYILWFCAFAVTILSRWPVSFITQVMNQNSKELTARMTPQSPTNSTLGEYDGPVKFSFLVSSGVAVSAVANAFSVPMADYFGRKRMIILGWVISTIGMVQMR